MSSGVITVDDFLYHIKHGKWKDIVEPIRKEEDKKKREILKKSLIAVTVSGVFAERKEQLILEHSGFISIDIDNFNDKARIDTDPYTYAVFNSASGRGLCVVVKVDKAKHKKCFRWLQKYYYETFGVVVDPAPQNPASLRFVSWDSELEINPKSKVSKALAREPAKPKSLPIVLTGEKVEEYVKEAVTRGLNVAESYQEYLNLSFALVDGFGENGRRYFHLLSSISSKYNERQADRQYDIAIKRGKQGISVGTFYYMLKHAGVNIKNDHQRETSLTVMAKKSGRSKEAIVQQLVTINNIEESSAKELVEHIYERSDLTLQSVTFDPERLIETLMQFIEQNHPIRKNLITKMIEENGKDVTKERLNTIFLRARAMFNSPSVSYDLIERIIFSEFIPEYHPITEYIENNRHRTSTGNIDKLVSSIVTNTPRAETFIKKWCVGIIAAYEGHAVRSLLALIGGQYTGKTEWFRRLLPKDLQKYYGESKLDEGKDDRLLMCSKLILMNDEMGGKSKQDEKILKDLTSKSVFSLREPYGRHNADFKRLAILGGTSNELDIMQDPTGNTRVFPIEVISINHELYNSIDKDDLFAELVREYEGGYNWLLTKEEVEFLKNMSKGYEGINFERECIEDLFLPNEDNPGFKELMTAVQIKDYIESNTRHQIRNMKLFGMQLKNYFGRSVQKKGIGWVYTVIKKKIDGSVPATNSTTTPVVQQPVQQPDSKDIQFFDGEPPF